MQTNRKTTLIKNPFILEGIQNATKSTPTMKRKNNVNYSYTITVDNFKHSRMCLSTCGKDYSENSLSYSYRKSNLKPCVNRHCYIHTQGKLFLVKKYSVFTGYVTSNFSPIISEDPTPFTLFLRQKVRRKMKKVEAAIHPQCGNFRILLLQFFSQKIREIKNR